MNAARPADLPDYDNPPVTEVVLGFQFATLSKLHNYHVGLLWERLRKKYSAIQEQAPLNPAYETFNAPSARMPKFELQTLVGAPMMRYWFTADDQLLQLQQDRLIHNWRKHEDDQSYPRYETVKNRFTEDLDLFRRFLKDEDLGDLQINQCEVTYVNIIKDSRAPKIHASLARVTGLWRERELDMPDLTFENATIGARWIFGPKDKPIGRVHLSMAPINVLSDGSEAFRLDITARGRPTSESIDAGLGLLDVEREAVVRTFAFIATPEMESKWEKKR